MGVIGTVGKTAVTVGKYASKGNIATALVTFAIAELISYALSKAAGDPERGVAAILTAGQRKATMEAQLAQTREADVQEFVAGSFQGLRPEKRLTELALMQRGVEDITPDGQPVLSYISQKLGINPQRLIELSNPSRMGDFSELQSLPQVSGGPNVG